MMHTRVMEKLFLFYAFTFGGGAVLALLLSVGCQASGSTQSTPQAHPGIVYYPPGVEPPREEPMISAQMFSSATNGQLKATWSDPNRLLLIWVEDGDHNAELFAQAYELLGHRYCVGVVTNVDGEWRGTTITRGQVLRVSPRPEFILEHLPLNRLPPQAEGLPESTTPPEPS